MSDAYDPTYPHWNIDPKDETLVRWWDGERWEKSIDPTVALLYQIASDNAEFASDNAELKRDMNTIRYRVGFLALVVLISLVGSVIIVVSSISALRGAGL